MTQEEKANPKRPTSLDVAKLAGVSRAQVSYVLSGSDSNHASSEKRALILAAVKQLGYQPHQSARALRKGFSNEFGLFFPAPYTPRINQMLGVIHEVGLVNQCMPTQYSFNSYHDAERKREAFEAMLARRPAGIFCSLLDIDRSDIEYARKKGVERILVLDVEPHDDLATFFLPAEQVGYLAASHLVSLGHRHLSIIQPADPIQSRGFALRLEGMKRAVSGMPNCQITVIPWPSENLRPTYAAACSVVRHFFCAKENRPSALYAFSDDYAFTILAASFDAGIVVPDELSILGTDDHEYSALLRPALSTIRFDTQSQGLRAVAMINALLLGETHDPIKNKHQSPELVARDTVRALVHLS